MTFLLPFPGQAQGGLPPSEPPHYPDAAHVLNGCYLSTVAYLARFRAAHPGERAWPVNVSIRNVDGRTRPHTLALVTWRGAWWGRDEYFGVFPLARAVGDGVVTRQVAERAERRLDRHSDLRARDQGLALPRPAPHPLALAERVREITTARALLPWASEPVWLTCGGERIPFLYFRPAEGQIAVYDPQTGTAVAECAPAEGTRVVAAVAARLGYAVGAGRPPGGIAAASGGPPR